MPDQCVEWRRAIQYNSMNNPGLVRQGGRSSSHLCNSHTYLLTLILSSSKYKSKQEKYKDKEEQYKSKFIAPKASAEGACILSEIGYYFRVWLVTEIVVCVVTVMLWYMGHTYRSQIWVQTGHVFWRLLL